jgi:CTP synthase (UTP-ammonia lyase)
MNSPLVYNRPMNAIVKIGLVGDRSDDVRAHGAIPKALESAARFVGLGVTHTWLPTAALAAGAGPELDDFNGIWCVPGSPYASMQGALAAIRHARERSIPFVGTCGGFQHALIEIARDVAGIASADHEESSPDAEEPIIHRLTCALREDEREVHILPGSRLASIYEREAIREGYQCAFGVNPKYRAALERAGVAFTADDDDGDPRAIELAAHPFFLATLFQFELAALRGATPPLAVAFLRAAAHRAE